MHVCTCVCVCVREREKERGKRERERAPADVCQYYARERARAHTHTHTHTHTSGHERVCVCACAHRTQSHFNCVCVHGIDLRPSAGTSPRVWSPLYDNTGFLNKLTFCLIHCNSARVQRSDVLCPSSRLSEHATHTRATLHSERIA